MRHASTPSRLSFAGISALVVTIFMVGCGTAMIESVPEKVSPSGNYLSYAEYALPRSVIVVTVSDATGTPADEHSTPNQKPAPAPATTGTTAAPAPASTAAAKARPAAVATDSQVSLCAALREEYAADIASDLKGSKDLLDFKRQRGNLDVDQWASVVARNEAIAATRTYIAKRRELDANLAIAMDRRYLIVTKCPLPYSVNITESVEADPKKVYRVYGRKNDLSSDQLTIATENGFLTSASGIGDHKGADYLVAIAKSIASLHVGSYQPDGAQATAAANTKLEDALKTFFKDPTPRNLKKAIDYLQDPDPLIPLGPTNLPLKLTYSIEDLRKTSEITVSGLDLKIAANCGDAWPSPAVTALKPVKGIVVSGVMPCTISVYPKDRPELLARATFAAVDSDSAYEVPIERTAFVKQQTTYTFSQGKLSKTEMTRPSPAIEVVSIPFKIIGSFTQAIADGIRGKKGQIAAQTELTKAQTEQIKATTELQKARDDASNNESSP